MKFTLASKSIFNYKNTEKGIYIKNHLINNLRLYCEYEVIFKNNILSSTDNSYLNIRFYKEDNTIDNIHLDLNKSYKFINKNISKIEIDLYLDESIINLQLLENPIVFHENTYENSSILKDFIKKIDLNNSQHTTTSPSFNINVACILDEFTYECFSHEVNLLQLKSMTWLKQIKDFNPDLLIVESAWYGICKTWIGKIACEEILDKKLLDLVNYCHENHIPTVFFNKEGLVNYNYFEKSSSIFDYVFVSDENIIPLQIKSCNHNNVYPLSFAAQPKIHNSINKYKYKLGNLAFAGGWYGDKHVDRLCDFEYILKPALNYNLHIYDRNYHQRSMLEFIDKYWPKEYLDYIVGRLEYNYMIEAYKNYSLFLNVNSVQNSSYMVSRRVYEILACKTMILSSYSKGIYDNFKDYILISHNSDETTTLLQNYYHKSAICDKLAKKSQRYILENHTYKNRIEEIFNIINLDYKKSKPIKVGLISLLNNEDSIENLYNILCNNNYPHIFTYLLIHKDVSLNKSSHLINLKNSTYHTYSSLDEIKSILQSIYNLNHNINYYALLNSKNYYAPNYIRDYVNTLSFVNADVIGKSHIFTYNKDDNSLNIINCSNKDTYVNTLYKDTIFFNSKFYNDLINNINLLNAEFITNNNKFIFYSDDEYNFLKNMYDCNKLCQSNINNICI